jgi:hypothetical protein
VRHRFFPAIHLFSRFLANPFSARLRASFATRALLPVEVLSAQGIQEVAVLMATQSVASHAMTQQGSSPSNLRFPAWQSEYEASLSELDPKRLLERVHLAEKAIFNRLQQLAQSSESADHNAEQQAIAHALNALRLLKRDKLNFPDWKTE